MNNKAKFIFLKILPVFVLMVICFSVRAGNATLSTNRYLAPKSFFSVSDFYIHDVSKPYDVQDLLPEFAELKSRMLYSYKGEAVYPYVEKVFKSLSTKKIYLFNPLSTKGNKSKKFLNVFNSEVNRNLLLTDSNSLGIVSDFVHLYPEADVFYLLFKAALMEYLSPTELDNVLKELFPEKWRKGKIPFIDFSREMRMLNKYYRNFFTKYDFLTTNKQLLNIPFKDVLIDSFGKNPSILHQYSLNKFMLIMHEDIASDQESRWYPVIHMLMNLLLDSEMPLLNTEKVSKFLKDSELSEGAQRYIIKCLRYKRKNIRKKTKPVLKQNVASLFDVLAKQHKSLDLALHFRQEAAWWSLYPKHAAEATKKARNVINFWSRDLLFRTGTISSRQDLMDRAEVEVPVSFDFSVDDADKFFDQYELKEGMIRENASDESMARVNYRQNLNLIMESMKSALQNESGNKLIANSLWVLHKRKLNYVRIENVKISFIGEGGWKMAFRAEVTLSDGQSYPFVIKGIKPKNGYSVSDDVTEELFRHQYYSDLGYSRFGVSLREKGITLITEEYLPELRIDEYLKENERHKMARIDYYMDMYKDRSLSSRRAIWRKAAVASFTGMLRSYLYNNEYVADPKPSNVVIEESLKADQTKDIRAIFFDTGEFVKVGPRDNIHSVASGLISMLVKGSDNGHIKGIESLYPELALKKPNGKPLEFVGFAEILLALDNLSTEDMSFVHKVLREKSHSAFFKASLENIRDKIDTYRNVEYIKTFIRLLESFPVSIQEGKLFKEVMKLLDQQLIVLDKTYYDLVVTSPSDLEPVLSIEYAA